MWRAASAKQLENCTSNVPWRLANGDGLYVERCETHFRNSTTRGDLGVWPIACLFRFRRGFFVCETVRK